MKIYIDNDFKCHSSNPDNAYMEIDTDFFNNKCTRFIEGFRYVPYGENWMRSDGAIFKGEMIAPWRNYEILEEAQAQYGEMLTEMDNMLVDYEYQLAALMPIPMSLDVELIENQNANEKLYDALKRIIYRGQAEDLEEKLNVFLAVGKLIENWYTELLNIIEEQNNI